MHLGTVEKASGHAAWIMTWFVCFCKVCLDDYGLPGKPRFVTTIKADETNVMSSNLWFLSRKKKWLWQDHHLSPQDEECLSRGTKLDLACTVGALFFLFSSPCSYPLVFILPCSHLYFHFHWSQQKKTNGGKAWPGKWPQWNGGTTGASRLATSLTAQKLENFKPQIERELFITLPASSESKEKLHWIYHKMNFSLWFWYVSLTDNFDVCMQVTLSRESAGKCQFLIVWKRYFWMSVFLNVFCKSDSLSYTDLVKFAKFRVSCLSQTVKDFYFWNCSLWHR